MPYFLEATSAYDGSTDQGIKMMFDQYEVVTSDLGVIFKTSDKDAAEDFGRWFRDKSALATQVLPDNGSGVVAAFPVNR